MMKRFFSGDKKKEEAAAAQKASEAVRRETLAAGAALGLPPQLTPAYADAIMHTNAAIVAEKDFCDLARAMQEYNEGLQLLISVLKHPLLTKDAEGGERTKQSLRTIIDAVMVRAEAVNDKKKAREGGGASSQSQQRPPSSAFIAPSLLGGSSRSAAVAAASSSSSSQAVASANPVFKIDPQLRAAIESEILTVPSKVRFSDVIGLEEAKAALHEMIVLPSLRPDLFTGLRAPPSGMLLYGPPGNGKSFLAKAVAGESNCTFFSISAASLMAKHLGEGEKLVRALFQIARERAPSIIFIDEIDSLMTRRSSDEHEASRRLKTELLVQYDAAASAAASPDARVLLMAATNLPEELDDALVRRLTRRVYLGAPTHAARLALLTSLLSQPSIVHTLSAADLDALARLTEGYSNSDLSALVSDAALAPLRNIPAQQLMQLPKNHLPPITQAHFLSALDKIRPSVSKERLLSYGAWAKQQEGQR